MDGHPAPRWLLAGALLGLALAAAAGDGAAQEAEGAHRIEMRDEGGVFRFEPARLEVPPDAHVLVVNAGDTPHTLTSADGTFDTGRVEPGGQATFRPPPNQDTYRFYCRYHAAPGSDPAEAMAGVLVVTATLQPDTHGDRLIPGPTPAGVLLALLGAAGLLLLPAPKRPRRPSQRPER